MKKKDDLTQLSVTYANLVEQGASVEEITQARDAYETARQDYWQTVERAAEAARKGDSVKTASSRRAVDPKDVAQVL